VKTHTIAKKFLASALLLSFAFALLAAAPFNPAQLASYSEARALRSYLNSAMSTKILDADDEKGAPVLVNPNFPWLPAQPVEAGIYRPKWEGGPAGFPEPRDGDRFFLHFRWSNGFSGQNVGLIVDKFKRYPNSPQYVLDSIRAEVEQAGR
jgi:hypothetical protein